MPENEPIESTAEASLALTECGLAHQYVDIMHPGLSWDVRLTIGADLTYDTLRRVADRFGTTDLRVRHVAEHAYSEWLEIRDPKVAP